MDIPSLPQHFDPKNGGMVSFGDDAKLYVKFERRSVLDQVKTSEAGRPVHAPIDFIIIQQPGERDKIDRPVRQEDLRRFPHHWAMFQNGLEEQAIGTPLAILFPANPEIVEDYRYAKVATVEQLASLTDTQMQNLGMGARANADKAKAFLAASSHSAEFHALEKQLKDKDLKLQELSTKVDALTQALANKTDEPHKRGPGRPPKEYSDAA